jgi:hypothetical protein
MNTNQMPVDNTWCSAVQCLGLRCTEPKAVFSISAWSAARRPPVMRLHTDIIESSRKSHLSQVGRVVDSSAWRLLNES